MDAMRPWFAVGVAALGGLAAEVLAVHAGVRGGSAVLDLAAGWALLGAALAAGSLTVGCRAMAGAAGVLWFVGTLQAVEADVARVGALWGSLYAAPLGGALLGAPAAWPRRRGGRAVVAWLWLRGAIPVLAAWNVGTLATGIALAIAGLRARGHPSGVAAGWAAVALGSVLGVAALSRLLGMSGGWVEDLLAVTVASCGAALIAVGRPSRSAVTSLVVDVGRLQDARTLERRLGDALGDPRLRLLYRLGRGRGWLDASGVSVPPPLAAAGREVTAVEADGNVSAVLVHDAAALDDRALREAVVAAVRLAVVRLRLAADAASQADALAASRRRLMEAAAAQRSAFAVEVRERPGAELGRAAELLAAAVDAAPKEFAELLQSAVVELAEARAELSTAVGGELGQVLRDEGLEAALARVAGRAGATADLRVSDGPEMPAAVATTAWYCASEAIANALKHAGGARIALAAYRSDGALIVEVSDDGPGGADPAGGGIGGLRTRAQALGGVVHMESPPGGGTRVRVELPLAPA
jgi:signal transduction histidine kinase